MQARHALFLFFILGALGYFLFEARGVLFAPRLVIYEPKEDTSVTSPVRIAGYSNADETILIEGREFKPNEQGVFSGTLILYPGYRRIGFLARDHFGNETKKIVPIVVK